MLASYAAYNLWANEALCKTVRNLTQEQWAQSIGGPFGSFEKLLTHLWDVEELWWQRLKLVEHPVAPSLSFSGDVSALCVHWLKASEQWKTWVASTTDATLQHTIEYRNSKREAFKQPVQQILLHLFNHQSFHRGQVSHALRTLGVQPPVLDYIHWSRKYWAYKI